jgi:hypothetical protein
VCKKKGGGQWVQGQTCRISVPSTAFKISPALTPAFFAGEPGANPAHIILLFLVSHRIPNPEI